MPEWGTPYHFLEKRQMRYAKPSDGKLHLGEVENLPGFAYLWNTEKWILFSYPKITFRANLEIFMHERRWRVVQFYIRVKVTIRHFFRFLKAAIFKLLTLNFFVKKHLPNPGQRNMAKAYLEGD